MLEGEVRSLVTERVAEVVRTIEDTCTSAASAGGARAEIESEQLYAGYELDPSDPVIQLASAAFARLGGGSGRLLKIGGGSDANELNVRGVIACVLGIGAENCHSVHEHMSVAELELLTAWVLEIVREASRGLQ
jgi:tripeptide aminopeptidase